MPLALLALSVLSACRETRDGQTAERTAVTAELAAAQRYLGQTPPGSRPQRFAPGIVSTDAVELNSVVSPDGREFFFTRLIEGPDEQEGYPGRTRPILHEIVHRNLYGARRLSDGTFADPANIGSPVNSSHGVGDTFVAPDEGYMVPTSIRTPSITARW